MTGYNIFINQIDQVVERYSNFNIVEDSEEKYLQGELQVVDRSGVFWESYQLEIKHHPDFPYRFPKVFEISDKIPKIADWHINKDHSFCIDVDASEIIKCKDGLSLIEFIEKELTPYLFNQTHRKVQGHYVGGEYSHGLKGIYEFYSDSLKTGDNVRKTLSLMMFIATHSRPNRSNKCFCESGELFRHCHRKAYDELKVLGQKHLENDLQLLYQWSGLMGLDRLRSKLN